MLKAPPLRTGMTGSMPMRRSATRVRWLITVAVRHQRARSPRPLRWLLEVLTLSTATLKPGGTTSAALATFRSLWPVELFWNFKR